MKPDDMMNTEGTDMHKDEPGGIDSIIARVESYIENPKLVTPETLSALKEELVDLKSYLDGEDAEEEGGGEESKTPALMVMIGKAKRGGT